MEQVSEAATNEFRGGEEHARIVFSLQQEPSDKSISALVEEREKHRRRAERFGARYVDPGRVRKDFSLVMEARRERLQASHGFTTGDLDLFSPEEREKRAARAARFQLEAPLAPSVDTYKPDADEEARARRAVKFGVPYQPTDAVLMDMDLYEQRREVGKDVERRPTAIYLYGVDVMSTREVLSYFSEYGPLFVEWLDDSSCNVLFSDANSTKRALVGKGTPLPPEVVTSSATGTNAMGNPQEGADVSTTASTPAPAARYQPELPVPDDLADVANLPYIWHKGQDFIKEGTPVTLVYRMATVLDVRDMNQPKRTRQLWRDAAGGGGGRGRRGGRGGRGGQGQGQRLGKRVHGGEDGPAAMDVDDHHHDDDDDDGPPREGEDGDVPMKRQRGERGGQKLMMRRMRPTLYPYGGRSLLFPGTTLLPAKGTVLDYTELEDEDPVAAAEAAAAEAGQQPGGGRGAGRGRAAFEGDLREVLKARKKAMQARLQQEDGGEAWNGAAAAEEDGEEGALEDRDGEMDS